jgi:hypothetical protein
MWLILTICLTQLLELVIALPIAIIFWPILALFFCLVKTVRFGVQLYLNHRTNPSGEDEKSTRITYEIASGSDSIFGYSVENNCNSIIPGFCVIEGEFDLELIKQKVMQMAEGNPKLRKRFVKKCGFFVWETNDDLFDIQNHVRIIADPNDVVDECKLMEIMDKLSVQEIDNSIPMWEVLLIPAFRREGKSFTV